MEFVQFHPTALFTEEEGRKFLISEAVRGEGAFLRNKYGERFMKNIHPKGELAPRDIVAQSIFIEMKKTKSKYVYLDITHRDRGFLKTRFPTIYNSCLNLGIDMAEDYIPVVPVEHYSIGGIKVDLNGRSSIKNLYACGECASTGVHGANRLASNSLLECLVFGRRAAEDINNNIKRINRDFLDNEAGIKASSYDENFNHLKYLVRETMDNHVGIVRNRSELLEAKNVICKILALLKDHYVLKREYLETLNMAIVAELIINSALMRRESIGCHYRID